MSNARDLSSYGPNLRPFLEILFRYEANLSDGYGYYCGSRMRGTMASIAAEMVEVARQLPEVKALVEAVDELLDVIDDDGYVSNSFTLQPLRVARNALREIE